MVAWYATFLCTDKRLVKSKQNLIQFKCIVVSVYSRAKKVRCDGNDWQLIKLNPSHEEILQELGLIPKPVETPKKKPGRPKGSKNKSKTVTNAAGTV